MAPPTNQFATHGPPTLIATSPAEGIVAVPAGWRVFATRSGREHTPLFELIAPTPSTDRIIVLVVDQPRDAGDLSSWLTVFATSIVEIAGESALRPVAAHPACVEHLWPERSHRYVACAVRGEHSATVAWIWHITPAHLTALGGHRMLIAIATSARPGTPGSRSP